MTTTPAQIIYDMPEAEYHASSGIGRGKYITRSMLKDFIESPRCFYMNQIAQNPLVQRKQNAGMLAGTIFEYRTIGGDQVPVVHPSTYTPDSGKDKGKAKPWNWNANACKDWKKEHAKDLICSQDDMDYAEFLRACFRDTALCMWTLKTMEHTQVVVRWRDAETNLPLQVRIDMVCKAALCDLKTGYDVPENFAKSARRFGYDMQDAMYSDAWEIATGKRLPFLFPYQQTKRPFRSDVIELDPSQKAHGASMVRDAIDGIKERLNSKDWADHNRTTVLVPEVPAYVYYEQEAYKNGSDGND